MTTDSPRPRLLLSRNGELQDTSRAEHVAVWGWSIPALAARLPSGETIKTCPAAGVCAQACYARRGRYVFRNVRERHLANLAYVVEDLEGWRDQLIAELGRKRGRIAVRIHDAGDFFSDAYLDAWTQVARAHPHVLFYAYTKEVARVRRATIPGNLVIRLSYGGREDHLIGFGDLVAEVFPTGADAEAAGFVDNSPSDLMAADPSIARLGIPYNRHPDARRRAAGRTFGGWQQDVNKRRTRNRT